MSILEKIGDFIILNGPPSKAYLLYQFPDQKRKIARLDYEKKMEWYASRDSKEMIFLGNDRDFQRFWYWHVTLPVKLRRLFYRVKNGEIFKRYKHISEIKGKKSP